MGVGAQASGAVTPHASRLHQPAYGEYAEEPKVEAQHERRDQESPADRFARRAQWPALFVLSLLEVAWTPVSSWFRSRAPTPSEGSHVERAEFKCPGVRLLLLDEGARRLAATPRSTFRGSPAAVEPAPD